MKISSEPFTKARSKRIEEALNALMYYTYIIKRAIDLKNLNESVENAINVIWKGSIDYVLGLETSDERAGTWCHTLESHSPINHVLGSICSLDFYGFYMCEN